MNKKVSDAISKIVFEFEALSIYPLSWKVEENKDIPTFCTDFKTLQYNPAFVDTLYLKETVAVILHEIFHCVFLHPAPVDRGFSKRKNQFIWTLALEQVVNSEVLNIINKKDYYLPGEAVSPKDILTGSVSKGGYIYSENFKYMNAIDVYNSLLPYAKNSGENIYQPNIVLINDINETENLPAQEKQEAIEKSIATIQKVTKKHGSISANLSRLLKELTTSKIPWKRILSSFLSKVVAGYDEYSFTKINTKHPLAEEIIIPATVSRQMDSVVVVIDTSGSITDNNIKEFASGIASMFKYYNIDNITLITTDTKINEIVKIKSIQDIISKVKFKGRGGTDFRPLFEKIKKCELMVFFTDGHATYPKKYPKYPVLWVMTEDHTKPPFGTVAHILSK